LHRREHPQAKAYATFARLTAPGRKILAAQREGWQQFADAIRRITGIDYV